MSDYVNDENQWRQVKGRRVAALTIVFNATQGSQNLALGLTMSAASQLDE